ncbi:alpha-amylase family glycosyl hydrolase [Polaribacter sp. Hel1_85]|uniref:alpha-amylase family glycosyl hydrolase n=1 Tax=Polaribacter sp. Hel1_85 TaxID=1250005 RepID=UPI00052C9751|nr:alpha-amylase family glycosyl hydrolase [Polaribacter sp. Hel1_85]KGL63873.1 glycoside hydrolase, CBM48 domain protein, GH13 family [Polaribacter sp. Hel1_85]
MKKITFIIFFLITSLVNSQVQNATFSVSPSTFNEDEEITVTVSGINTSSWGVSDIYLWAWSLDSNGENTMDSPTNGTWTNTNEAQKLTNNGNGTFSFTMVPTTFYNRTGIGKIGMLVKAKDGTGDKKSQDQLFNVGVFQLTLNSPTSNPTILNSGETIAISATTSLVADFNLKANGVSIDTQNGITEYSFSPALTETTTFILEATNTGITQTSTFEVIVKPTVVSETLPANMKDGINLNTTDNTKATLVFYAPGKEFIHVIGDFNSWNANDNYLMKKDFSKDRFWIELTGLTPQTNHTYQYLINGTLRVADPYSTVVLTESNDQYINATTYPDLPAYPTGDTNHSVTLLRTGDTPYNWQVTNFEKPAKTDLVIYELLIRDFDELHSFDAVKARLDYLQDLGINAIEFMPIMEFDGNESWGYNPSFHMALDKYYGSKTAFKQLIDECHARGIAIIVDVAFNHASGQNPYYRMWNTDNGSYGGQASGDSPFFNATDTHAYSVFNDFNHSKQATKDYVRRVTEYWIDEYKIDGFRWDLTKGFTQNCASDLSNENGDPCTNGYNQDRVDVLKEYADYQWDIDPNFYVIFEHLGGNDEETEWVNYRLGEGKGIMMWGNHNHQYNEATQGFNSGSDFSWISYKNRGWSAPANVGYMESHDEERLMYKNLQFGNSSGSYNIKDLDTALDRIELAGAFYFTIPGPKMIWQFGELGYDYSIDFNGRVGNKPIKWDYFEDQNRKDVYNTWSKIIQLRLKYDIFETTDFSLDVANSNGLKKIHLTNPSATGIQSIVIIGNFGVTTQGISPFFQQTGTWYDLLDENSTINVTNTTASISLAPGEFKIYANKPATLSNEDIVLEESLFKIYPNPAKTNFTLSSEVLDVNIYDVTGKQVKKYSKDIVKTNFYNVSDLNHGIYFIRIKNKNNQIQTKKLIIN